MLVEVATTESFRQIRHAAYLDVLPESDFTGKLLLEDLPPGQDIFYRIRFQNLSSPAIVGEPQVGRFRTAPADRRSVSFIWSGDTAGGGWGIDLARGGMRTYATMLANRPDFFIHSGDSIYADCPIAFAAQAAERRDVAQHRHRGEVEGRRDARRVPRQLQIQSPRRQHARVQCRGADLRAMGRSRGHRRLAAPAAPCATRRLSREEPAQSGGARLPRLPRIHAAAADAGRGRPHLPQDLLRSAARRVHARHALVSRRQRRATRRAMARTPICSVRRSSPGSSASSCVRARPGR